ncbi:MAG: DNA-directed RNA polymerase [Methanomassiliicoccales archaeon]|jgi:DNA-directed RNA polymerase subunit E'|nr:DNA-directed RNA polymerase [Methanomassiliicoccales archaeon]
MYLMAKREKVVRIPPDRLAEDLDATVVELAKESFEGKVEGSDSLTVLIRNIHREGPGRIVHGDGAVYQKVTFESLIFRPVLQEVVEGTVVEVLKFGAFVRFGPLDGLLHISQIMDDRIDVDDTNQRLLGKDTKRDLRVGDKVRARIVALSINERNPRESKIGLTMRQAGLGKFEWLEEDRKKKGEKEKGAAA